MRILLIEDDPQLSEALASFLRAKGFVVDTAGTLAQARATLPAAHWGAVLLDLHLPDGDGLSLLPLLQRQHADSSVIVLTARDQITDRIRGLDAGADDYLVKPFDPEELLARLRAVERRRGGAHGQGATRGPLVFSAITGGTQTQHWRGGGVGRSLILLAFLFTFKSGIRGVKP